MPGPLAALIPFLPYVLGPAGSIAAYKTVSSEKVGKAINTGITCIAGKKYCIHGPSGAGKSTLHDFFSGKSYAIDQYKKTLGYGSSSRGQVKVTWNGQIQGRIRHRKSVDYGGEEMYWETWDEGIHDCRRFIFMFSLFWENPSNGAVFNGLKNSEDGTGFALDYCSPEFELIERAFSRSLECITKTFSLSGGKYLPEHCRKLVIFCNKIDALVSGGIPDNPSKLRPIREAEERFRSIARSKCFEEETGFELIFSPLTLNPYYSEVTQKLLAPIYKHLR